ncbi:MAG: DUF2510 domain-containing protein [Coriobacteriales bacterium]|nr:DUF2510 domain-containing protein [Actinomycetes bacterium]
MDQSGGNPAGAGWLEDPGGRHQYRYWDGTAWTDHVADGGQQSLDPLAPHPDSVAELRRREVEVESELAEVDEQLSRAASSSNDADLASLLIADVEERMRGGGTTGARSPILRRGELQAELESIRQQLANLDQHSP